MSNSATNPSDVFDVRKIRRLVELMREYDLSILDLQQGDQRVRLRRGTEPIVAVAPAAVSGASAPLPASQAAGPSAGGGAAGGGAAGDGANVVEIKSPMVGTFYPAPSPDASPFVKVGDVVGPETTVCIVEAMKVFNEIPAETSGRIVAVLAENGDPVEYGQPLFKVDTSK